MRTSFRFIQFCRVYTDRHLHVVISTCGWKGAKRVLHYACDAQGGINHSLLQYNCRACFLSTIVNTMAVCDRKHAISKEAFQTMGIIQINWRRWEIDSIVPSSCQSIHQSLEFRRAMNGNKIRRIKHIGLSSSFSLFFQEIITIRVLFTADSNSGFRIRHRFGRDPTGAGHCQGILARFSLDIILDFLIREISISRRDVRELLSCHVSIFIIFLVSSSADFF